MVQPAAHAAAMDSRWQPHLGPVRPAFVTPEACDLLAAGWSAQAEECWIGGSGGQAPRMVSLETWRALRDRSGFIPVRLRMQDPAQDPNAQPLFSPPSGR